MNALSGLSKECATLINVPYVNAMKMRFQDFGNSINKNLRSLIMNFQASQKIAHPQSRTGVLRKRITLNLYMLI